MTECVFYKAPRTNVCVFLKPLGNANPAMGGTFRILKQASYTWSYWLSTATFSGPGESRFRSGYCIRTQGFCDMPYDDRGATLNLSTHENK